MFGFIKSERVKQALVKAPSSPVTCTRTCSTINTGRRHYCSNTAKLPVALWAAVSVSQWEHRSQSSGFIETNNKLKFSYSPEQQSAFHFSVNMNDSGVWAQSFCSDSPNTQTCIHMEFLLIRFHHNILYILFLYFLYIILHKYIYIYKT